jgi:hypothetical protein
MCENVHTHMHARTHAHAPTHHAPTHACAHTHLDFVDDGVVTHAGPGPVKRVELRRARARTHTRIQ